MVATTSDDRATLTNRRSLRRRLVRVLGLVLVSLSLFVFWRWVSGNLGEVVPNRVYRSAQLGPTALARLIRTRGIKTVLNLRGRNPNASWYRRERETALASQATQIDFSMASDLRLTRAQARTLLDVLNQCEYPIVIHCEWGAERTGLVSAIVALSSAEGSIEKARSQFSPYYLFLPTAHGRTMRSLVDSYQSWLEIRRLDHSADTFRRWIRDDYRPNGPSREDWRYNPYPLAEIERPGSRERLTIPSPSASIGR